MSFAAVASFVADWAGRPSAFVIAVASVLVWAALGPHYGYSETWQIVINTGTTIVTFLMIFLLQNSQNRDGKAIQRKLDELIRSSAADDRMIGIERIDE